MSHFAAGCHPRSRSPIALAVAAALFLGPSLAAADVIDPSTEDEVDWERPFEPFEQRQYGLGIAAMHLRYARAADPSALRGAADLLEGGISARGLYGHRICYGVGLGIELGAARAPGLGFGFDFYPVGVAIAFGQTGYVGAFFGLRVDGITGRVPFMLMVPAELRAELDVTRRFRVGALFGVAWAPKESSRDAGSPMIPSIDETIIALSARIGRTFPRFGATYERGYFVRLERREQMRTVLYGIAVGAEVGVAN